jgi:hypothetical protein
MEVIQMTQPRKPIANGKIIVDDLETKQMIMYISDKTGESMKAIIQRLVYMEHHNMIYKIKFK